MVDYELAVEEGDNPGVRAMEVAREQTVELPAASYAAELEDAIVGRLESLAPEGTAGRWRARMVYSAETVGDDLLQLVNLVAGNVSMMQGVRVTDVELTPGLLARFRGPSFGARGLRALAGVEERRPVIVSAAKPMGLTSAELAERCAQLARAGVDFVKDDHGITNQTWAPFRERVPRCHEAVERANQATGGRTVYVPNVTGPIDELMGRLEFVAAVGCPAVVITPMLSGLDSLRWIARRFELAIFAHPAFSGGFYAREQILAPEVLFGLFFRLAGADAVIFPNARGRFPLSDEACLRTVERLRRPLGDLAASLPVAGGGVNAQDVARWTRRYGWDVGYLVGSSLYAEGDLEAAGRRLVAAARELHG
jgi:ribulose-bisphosphate carboxylase large chain